MKRSDRHGRKAEQASLAPSMRRNVRANATSQRDLPPHLQETIRREIEAVRRAHRIAIQEREQHAPPWRQTWRALAAHHLIAGGEIDGIMKIDRATLLLGTGKRR